MTMQSYFDDIRAVMPDILDLELEKRAKLRSYRNAACVMLSTAKCDTARHPQN